jgi:very-short-patch-repair endonuclease
MPSNFEEETLSLLKEAFPSAKIVPQYSVNYMKNQLFFDFYLPAMNVLIECQGEQHYKFVTHFHGTQADYKEAKRRDQLKREWSTQQGIPLLEIKFNERPETSMELFRMIHKVVFNE